jgi:outer membrane protein OmpU
MKKVLLTSTALVLSAGIAAADVSVGGDGRMGIIDARGASDIAFTSRIRISFSASGETDGGLSFGGSIRADNSGAGASGTAGNVFVEGAFGKLSMGDVSGAAEAAVGDVSGVGLTGLGDFNETTYLSNGATERPGALYEYSAGDLTFYASAGNPAAAVETMGVGVSYGMSNFTVALGYETADDGVTDVDHTVVGATATFGDATVKAVYGDASDLDFSQTLVSLDYVFGAATATAFYRNNDFGALGDVDGFGIGVAYDLGGGAALKAGYVDIDDGVPATDDDAFDFGISMSF